MTQAEPKFRTECVDVHDSVSDALTAFLSAAQKGADAVYFRVSFPARAFPARGHICINSSGRARVVVSFEGRSPRSRLRFAVHCPASVEDVVRDPEAEGFRIAREANAKTSDLLRQAEAA